MIITAIVADVISMSSKGALVRPFRAFPPRALFGEVQDKASKDGALRLLSSLVCQGFVKGGDSMVESLCDQGGHYVQV